MLSKFFKLEVNREEFKVRFENILDEIKDKKVIIYGVGDGFRYFYNKYDLEKLNIIALADRRFREETEFFDYKAIPPEQIFYQDYDLILVTNEYLTPVMDYLIKTMKIDENKIETVFDNSIKDCQQNYFYLEYFNFEKTLAKLTKKLRGKKVILYCAGAYLECINKYYDLSGLNIIGVSDKRFEKHKVDEKFLGYPVYSPQEVLELKPDYVLFATKFYVKLMENLYDNMFKNTKIKMKPLVKKNFSTLFKEVFN